MYEQKNKQQKVKKQPKTNKYQLSLIVPRDETVL